MWAADQATAFLKAVRDDRLYAAWALAVVCGLRRGELAGLRWSDLDLDRGLLHVRWQRTVATGQGDHGIVEKEPKGGRERRIGIGEAMVTILREHGARQERERVLYELIYRDGDWVFCWEDGRPYRPQYFTARFGTCAARQACPRSCSTTRGTHQRQSVPTAACHSMRCGTVSATPTSVPRTRSTRMCCRRRSERRQRPWSARSSRTGDCNARDESSPFWSVRGGNLGAVTTIPIRPRWTTLVTELRDSRSPVTVFLKRRFPHVKELQQQYREGAGPLLVEGRGDSSTMGEAF